MNKITAKYSLTRIDEIYTRTLKLPKEIITDDDFKNESSTDNNYEQKRLKILFDAQQICLETRSLIKLIFGHESEYLKWINRISFNSESSGLIMNTYNINHNTYWQKGKNEIISLLLNIKSEEQERMKYEDSLIDRTLPFKYAITIVLFIIFTLATWTTPAETISIYFDSSKVIPVRFCFSLIFSALLAMIIFKEHIKELLITVLLTIFLSLIGFIKSETPIPVNSNQIELPKQTLKTK